MVDFDGFFCDAQLLLHDFRLDAQVRQLVAESLCLDAQLLALLFANLDFLLQHHPTLNSHIVL